KTVNGSAHNQVWDRSGSLPLLLDDGSNQYVYGPGGLPLEQVTGSSVLFFLQDQLGSTRGMTDSSGSIAGTYTYGAYGQTVLHTGGATPLQYAGQYTDAESGLQYLRARCYDPSTAQFLTVDPALMLTGDPYGYAAKCSARWRDT
ncbi:MAG: RHS repeat-associated core domain-containing protein, partial [Chloroflexota bacterium]